MLDERVFFAGWSGLLRVAVIGVLAYLALVLLLRVSDKRTLSKLNAFDLVVTVALGSTLATIILSKDVALTEGVMAFVVLIGLQFVITWLSVRSSTVSGIVKSDPTLLSYRGRLLNDAMRRARITDAEIQSAIRGQGLASITEAEAVVLETDGTLNVVRQSERQGPADVIPTE